MLSYLAVAGISLLGGFLQSITGFGAGIVIMLALPNLMPMTVAASANNTITTPVGGSIAWHYRRFGSYRKIVLPAIIYIVFSTAAICISAAANLSLLRLAFGIVLVLLAVYFLFFNGKLKLKGGPVSTLVCSMISGLLGGFFGIGGPPQALYFLAITGSKEEYLGTLNALFFIVNVYTVFARIAAGTLTAACIPYTIAGIAGIAAGRFFGGKVSDRIDGARMQKYIYVFLAFCGIVTILQAV